MKIKRILIENFRSIKKSTIEVGAILALVGENSSGKTTVLRALNAFFNFESEKVSFDNETHRYSSSSSVTRIEIRFTDLPDDGFFENKKINGEIIIRMRYLYSSRRRTLEYKSNGSFITLSVEDFSKILSYINYVYIPINRDYTQMQWLEDGLLQKVVKEYLHRYTRARDVLSPMVRTAASNFERLGLNKIVEEVGKYYGLNRDFSFKIGFSSEIDYSLLLNDIVIEIKDSGILFNIADTGSGIQSITTIALYRYLAQLQHSNYILGIEEPETNLHPQAQREFIKSFKTNLVADKEVQILFTTHSSVIVDQMEHDEIVLFRRVKDPIRNFRTVSRQLSANFWEENGIEEFKYYQFYRYRNSEFFFSRFVIIVESKNDAQVIRHLLEQKSIDPDLQGVTFLSLDGVKNLKYPFFLMRKLAIPHFFIVDKDFFLPYINDELKASRSASGFPRYKEDYSTTNKSLIEGIIPNVAERNLLLGYLKNNHGKALDILVKYRFITMNYTLDMDLVSSHTASSHYYTILGVPVANKNSNELLSNRSKQIKKIDNMLEVLSNTPHKNLPLSYKKIKNVLGDIVKNLTSVSESLTDQ